MSFINRRLGTFETTQKVWSGAVGGNINCVDPTTNLCARALIVATIGAAPGDQLVVQEAGVAARIYTAADILAEQGILRGQFEQITAAGSVGCYDITIGW